MYANLTLAVFKQNMLKFKLFDQTGLLKKKHLDNRFIDAFIQVGFVIKLTKHTKKDYL